MESFIWMTIERPVKRLYSNPLRGNKSSGEDKEKWMDSRYI